MIKVNPQDVEVDSSNPKFKVYVPERVHAFYPILLQPTNTILNFFGPQIFTTHRNVMQFGEEAHRQSADITKKKDWVAPKLSS